MTVKVVTDSTADLPSDVAESLGITVVPLYVHFGTEVLRDGVDILPDEFYRRLTEGPVLPTTSQPSVGDFVDVYEKLAQDSDGVVSVHISSMLSGTVNSATQAKAQMAAGKPVEVVDTLRASMTIGLVAMAAARAAQDGASLEEVAGVANDSAGRSHCIAMLDTLEYLEKGGRIGKAKALLGSLLKIRPLIRVEGEVHEMGKERSRQRGIARIQKIAVESGELAGLAVMHSTTPDDAVKIGEALRKLLPEGKEPVIAQFGPVIGTYAGPGALGIGLLDAASP